MSTSFSSQARDKLKEVFNIGTGNASIALSTMVKHGVDISVPRLEVLSIEDVIDFVGEAYEVRNIVLLKILGDSPGVILFVLEDDHARRLAQLLTGNTKNVRSEMDTSALLEIGNILTGSCLTALGNFLNTIFSQSVPDTATDMVGALLSPVLAELGAETDDVLVSNIVLRIEDADISGSVFFIFSPDSSQSILNNTEKQIR